MQVVAIQDANILIDLVNIQLFDLCLALPYRFTTLDIILHGELNEEQTALIHPHVQSGKFSLITIPAEDMSDIINAAKENARLSLQDWSVYYYAQKLNGILLTGDKRLRLLAEAKNIQVCGMLWILDELLRHNITTTAETMNYLKELMAKNKRLPLDECARRAKVWGGK